MKLVIKKCQREMCPREFKVLKGSTQQTCSLYCLDEMNNSTQLVKSKRHMAPNDRMAVCQKKKTESQRIKEAAQRTERNKESSLPSNVIEGIKRAEKDIKKTQATGKVKGQGESSNMRRIKTVKMQGEQGMPEKIRRVKMQGNESGTKVIESKNLNESSSDEDQEIQLLDSDQLYSLLDEEKSGSIQLLNDIAEQSVGYAKSLARPMKVDENDEVIQRAPAQNISEAVKCLELARNVMKTKLDYLKFGSDMLEKFTE